MSSAHDTSTYGKGAAGVARKRSARDKSTRPSLTRGPCKRGGVPHLVQAVVRGPQKGRDVPRVSTNEDPKRRKPFLPRGLQGQRKTLHQNRTSADLGVSWRRESSSVAAGGPCLELNPSTNQDVQPNREVWSVIKQPWYRVWAHLSRLSSMESQKWRKRAPSDGGIPPAAWQKQRPRWRSVALPPNRSCLPCSVPSPALTLSRSGPGHAPPGLSRLLASARCPWA